MAHLDTVDSGLSPDVHPQVIRGYKGGDICLNAEKDLWLRTADHPEVEDYVGDDLVVTDGTSVLGADNKSAIANVMTVFSRIVKENRPHGNIYLAFVPDEEIGLCGAKKMDFSKFPVDFAYTIDCCALGEVVYQTFNAGSAFVTIKGVTAHPMSAKGVLINPTLIATDLVQMLDRTSTPECTEGTEGFIEMRKNVDITVGGGNKLYLTNADGEFVGSVSGEGFAQDPRPQPCEVRRKEGAHCQGCRIPEGSSFPHVDRTQDG